MGNPKDDARDARRAQLRELARRAADHAAAADVLRDRLAALTEERPSAPTPDAAPPEDALVRIRAALERSQAELVRIRDDIERTAAERDARPPPPARLPLRESHITPAPLSASASEPPVHPAHAPKKS